MKLKDKVALITGGSLGLGKAAAFLFAKEGAKVIITGRTESSLQNTVDEGKQQGLEIDHMVGDVSDEQRTIETVQHIIDKYGKIDILFNNAGVLFLGT
ncbi:MAG: SDR family NAD(P)-dependent oxidoreductase, partial [Thermodesulfobacteriota bacterium]